MEQFQRFYSFIEAVYSWYREVQHSKLDALCQIRSELCHILEAIPDGYAATVKEAKEARIWLQILLSMRTVETPAYKRFEAGLERIDRLTNLLIGKEQ